MNITLLIITAILLSLVYFSKRRYGLLALALVAGSIISASWSSYVTIMLQIQGIKLISPPLKVVVAVILVVLPAILLLFVGPKYRKKWQRIIGGVLFGVLGGLLIAAAIAREGPDLMTGNQVGAIATRAYALIVVIGVVLAIADTILAHLPKKGRKPTD